MAKGKYIRKQTRSNFAVAIRNGPRWQAPLLPRINYSVKNEDLRWD